MTDTLSRLALLGSLGFLVAALAGCGASPVGYEGALAGAAGHDTPGYGGAPTDGTGGQSASTGGSSTSGTSTGGSGTGGSSTGGSTTQPGQGFMGKNHLMVGAMMEDVSAAAAPFDARYIYLAGAVPEAGACTSCSSACSNWWGCWQDLSKPPGDFVKRLLNATRIARWDGVARPQIPVFTYYVQLHASKQGEGAGQLSALNDANFISRYLGDYRFLLTLIGTEAAIVHVEPDLWGFLRQTNSNPSSIPVKIKAGNPTDCANEEDTAAGLGKCMIRMARKYSPNAKVGLHASPWWITRSDDGRTNGEFMKALGAAQGDFIATDPCDRDAGFYDTKGQNKWWDDAKARAYLAWSKQLSQTIGLPNIMWQIPVGNMAQNNTSEHWKDNRVDWLFAHMQETADAHVVALLFGAGAAGQTTPESDGGNLIQKTRSYHQSGVVPLNW